MPLRLDVSKKLSARSDRVKAVDIHPSEPWLLASLYNGIVYIYNYVTQNMVKSFEVTDLPVRTAKFITRKQWIVCGSDDMFLRVYNYNTLENIHSWEAHNDYIRSVAVHPTLPYVLSSSDDLSIKLWDWEKNWANIQVFEGHTHYVMMIAFNPKDTNTFATASLDKTVKVWGLGTNTPYFTLDGHQKGVNCVSYFVGGDKPYLVTGADDNLVRVWDYQSKACVATLEGHTNNVSVVCHHPELPIIISGSEDGTVKIWHAHTYRLEKTLNYRMERVWSLSFLEGTNLVALGYDEGTVMIKLGHEAPALSMEQNGKIIWSKHNEILTANLRSSISTDTKDGESISYQSKELGNCEVFPQKLIHNPNGRFVVACGDGEYIIYTALAWRNKSFGSALDFVWGSDTNFATRETTSRIKIFKNFKETHSFAFTSGSAQQLYGGTLIGVKSDVSLTFYDWEEARIVRKMDVVPKNIYWNDGGELVTIACESSFFILKYNREIVQQFFDSGNKSADDGIEESFDVLHEISERVYSGVWAGDCFLYTNGTNKLNYCVGSETVTLAHMDRKMFLLGYLPKDNRVYLVDKSVNVVTYTLHLAIINYQTAVLREDFDAAHQLLPNIPKDQHNRIAQFLEAQGYHEQALEVSTDPDHRFELAVQLGYLSVAYDILAESTESDQKWKQLSDLAFSCCDFDLAETCLQKAGDLTGLLLLYTSTGDAEKFKTLANSATKQGKFNLSFISFFLLNQLDDCLKLLIQSDRIPEAALFARTYLPDQISYVVSLWKKNLTTKNPKAAESLADPQEYPNLFQDLDIAINAQQHFQKQKTERNAIDYISAQGDNLSKTLLEEFQQGTNPYEVQEEIYQEGEEEEQEEQEEQEEEQEEQEEELVEEVEQPELSLETESQPEVNLEETQEEEQLVINDEDEDWPDLEEEEN